jgi:Arm DNA-binding domain
MSLNDDAVRNAKPGTKPKRTFDGGGLYLEVSPAGGKLWRCRYHFGGKQNAIALGVYPAVGLEDARKARDGVRQLLAQGIDPAQVRRQEKARDKSEHLAAMDASTVKVSASINGTVEIWKGRAVMCLSSEEARAVKALLVKLTT